MPNTTYGTPYAQSSDLVSNWPGVSSNVADRIDDVSFKGNGLNDQTGTTYTLVLTDAGKTVTLNNASAVTVTVPTNDSVAYETGTVINLVNKGAGVVTISPAGGVTLNNALTIPQNGSAALRKLETNTWAMIAAAAPGLTYITQASLGTAASVSINNCFTSTYDVYRIIVTGAFKSGAADNFRLRLRLNGTDDTTNYNYQYIFANGASVSSGRVAAATGLVFASLSADGSSAVALEVFNPAAAKVTQFISTPYHGSTTATPTYVNYHANHSTATAYDGITIYPDSNAFGGGTIRIYGYRNA